MRSIPQHGDLVENCPTETVLQSFVLGTLPEVGAEDVARHLDGCRACASLLPELAHEDDFLSGLRKHVYPATGGAPADGDTVPTIVVRAPDAEVVAPAAPAGNRVVGPYRLLERLGGGAMGVVYKARHRELGHIVAVKLLYPARRDDPEFVKRLGREAKAVARLKHPNIVRLHDAGNSDEGPFFAMEYVGGGTLAEKWGGKPQNQYEAAGWVERLARAVDYAHNNHVLHRDLKPANVLLEPDGTLKLSDFGLAKLADAADGFTQTEELLGTAAYMAPEQARGDARMVSPAADVYGLGAVLYEALTGAPPFQGARHRVLEAIQSEPPVAPRRRRPELSAELEAICLKCLEKEPRRRYPSAKELADDLDNWLEQRPTKARPPRWPRKVGRMLARHKWACAAMVVVAAALGAALYLQWRLDPDRPRREAKEALAKGRPAGFQGTEPLPGPFRWVLGNEQRIEANTAEQCFQFHTMTNTLLEFIDDPNCSHYRLDADIRHDDVSDDGEVGLFVGFRRDSPDGKPHYRFYTVSFAARGTRVTPGTGANNLNTSTVRLTACFCTQADRVAKPPVGTPYVFHPFQRPGTPVPWHHLAVEVSPDKIITFWRPTPDSDDELADTVTTKQLDKEVRRGLKYHDQMAGVPLALDPHGGVGIYAWRSTISVRNLVLKPLPWSPQ